MKFLLSIGGASGSIYGVTMLKELKKAGHEVHLIVSKGGKRILKHETDVPFSEVQKNSDVYYENDDLFAGPASGSFTLDGMIIVPCSMKTLSAVANGYGDTLTSRAASCCLKEGRKVVLVIRETPLDLPGINNMLLAKQAGAILLPACPGFYHKPREIEEVVDFIVGKVFDQFALPHKLFKRWR
jgi:4-hydroxy-3-polyprenylbenzoate decarboxylase